MNRPGRNPWIGCKFPLKVVGSLQFTLFAIAVASYRADLASLGEGGTAQHRVASGNHSAVPVFQQEPDYLFNKTELVAGR